MLEPILIEWVSRGLGRVQRLQVLGMGMEDLCLLLHVGNAGL